MALVLGFNATAQPTFLRRTLPVNQSDQAGVIPTPTIAETNLPKPDQPQLVLQGAHSADVKAKKDIVTEFAPVSAIGNQVDQSPESKQASASNAVQVTNKTEIDPKAQKTQLDAEMYYKIDQAVDAIVREYGSPRIVRLVTNDEATKEEFRIKFGTQRKALELERELAELTARRTAILADLTQRQQASEGLNKRMLEARNTLEKIELVSIETTVAIDKVRAQIKKSKESESLVTDIEALQKQKLQLQAEVNSAKEELKSLNSKTEKKRKSVEGNR